MNTVRFFLGSFIFCLMFYTSALNAGAIPIDCIRYSLAKSFSRIAVDERSEIFVRCQSENSIPIRGQVRPVYSADQVSEIYNSFVNVTDCLKIDSHLLFPMLMIESGFHSNIQNPTGGDAGVGQLTSKAIIDVENSMGVYKKYIMNNKNPSCKWIAEQTMVRPQLWKRVEGKCDLICPKMNPLKNILYTSIFYKINESYVNSEFIKCDITKLLIEAKFNANDFGVVKSILYALGYNTGGKTAVLNLKEFLLSRIDFINRKSQEMNVSANERGWVTKEDFNFVTGLERFEKIKNNIKIQLVSMDTSLKSEGLEFETQKALRNISVSKYSFPEWLKVWQSHGGPGYVSSLLNKTIQIEEELGVGICSDSKAYLY